ncbi:MAG TPA: SMC-Scp complex subunit ScpB [Candidatus Aphodomonas merdavium]|nr:SMC-Scp complex subunit ScpB [Candidatus Aphodomonas merdavium]
MELKQLCGAIEAILYVAGEPVQEDALRVALETTQLELENALTTLESGYEFERRGIRLLRFGSSVQLSTRPEYAPYVERMLQPVQKQNLTQAAMETLAVIAYRQPVTRGDIEAIRGVKCDYSVQSLLNKGLIAEAGRRDTLGHPMQFCTTDAFLRHFGIASLEELPQLKFAQEENQPQQDAAEGENNTAEANDAAGPEERTAVECPAQETETIPPDEGEKQTGESLLAAP